MNNNPNNNRRPDGRVPRPQNEDLRQRPVGRPHPQDGREMSGNRPPVSREVRPPQRPIPQRPASQQSMPQQSQNRIARRDHSRLTRVAVIWVAVLAVILAVILITAGLRNERDDDTLQVNGTTIGTTEVSTTEETTTLAVEHAEYTDNTRAFSADLAFANGILIDVESNTVVASRGGDARIYPASMTKVMTLVVAAEQAKDLDETFTMTAEITDPLFQANASVAGFLVGEQVTVRDLIYGLVLPSGGDGAMGLAYHLAGSEEAFAELMNEKARELGLVNTHFTNCTGLHNDEHYSTCHEIAMIVEYAIKDPFMREVLTTYQYTTESTPEHPEGILLTSTLLSRMAGNESGTMFVQGGKTGYTIEAKNCLASFATPIIPGMGEDELKLQPTKYILVTAGNTEKFGPVFDAISVYKSFVDGDEPAETAGVADVPVVSDEPENTNDSSVPVKIYTAKAPS